MHSPDRPSPPVPSPRCTRCAPGRSAEVQPAGASAIPARRLERPRPPPSASGARRSPSARCSRSWRSSRRWCITSSTSTTPWSGTCGTSACAPAGARRGPGGGGCARGSRRGRPGRGPRGRATRGDVVHFDSRHEDWGSSGGRARASRGGGRGNPRRRGAGSSRRRERPRDGGEEAHRCASNIEETGYQQFEHPRVEDVAAPPALPRRAGRRVCALRATSTATPSGPAKLPPPRSRSHHRRAPARPPPPNAARADLHPRSPSSRAARALARDPRSVRAARDLAPRWCASAPRRWTTCGRCSTAT